MSNKIDGVKMKVIKISDEIVVVLDEFKRFKNDGDF